jgi:hypothetical protein
MKMKKREYYSASSNSHVCRCPLRQCQIIVAIPLLANPVSPSAYHGSALLYLSQYELNLSSPNRQHS